eukprot:c35428_g1_i1 orf=60-221(+)
MPSICLSLLAFSAHCLRRNLDALCLHTPSSYLIFYQSKHPPVASLHIKIQLLP